MKISILRCSVLTTLLICCVPPLSAQVDITPATQQSHPFQDVSNLVDSVELSLVPKWQSSGIELRLRVQYSLFQSSSRTVAKTRNNRFGSLILYSSEE